MAADRSDMLGADSVGRWFDGRAKVELKNKGDFWLFKITKHDLTPAEEKEFEHIWQQTCFIFGINGRHLINIEEIFEHMAIVAQDDFHYEFSEYEKVNFHDYAKGGTYMVEIRHRCETKISIEGGEDE
jgi:hypothetical protein